MISTNTLLEKSQKNKHNPCQNGKVKAGERLWAIGFLFGCSNMWDLGLLILLFVAFYFVLFDFQASRRKFHFFHKKIGFGKLKSLLKIYHNYFIFGQVLLDKVVVMAGIDTGFTYDVENRGNQKTFSEMDRGGMLISAHAGNWELAGHFLNGRFKGDKKANILMLDAEHSSIKDLLDNETSKDKINIIPLKEDGSHIFQIHKVLTNKEIICTHGDRHMEGIKTVKANFMGEPALFPAGPFFLAKRFKVPYVYFFAARKKYKKYKFYYSPVRESDTSLEEIVQHFANDLEQFVREYPEQWFNFHDFWKMPAS